MLRSVTSRWPLLALLLTLSQAQDQDEDQDLGTFVNWTYPPSDELYIRINDTIVFEWTSDFVTPYFVVWGPAAQGSNYDYWGQANVGANGSIQWKALQAYAGEGRDYWADGLECHVQMMYRPIPADGTQQDGPNGPGFRVGPSVSGQTERTYALSATNPPLPSTRRTTTTPSTSSPTASTTSDSSSSSTSAPSAAPGGGSDDDDSGISGGAIAGIVIGVIGGIAVVVAAIVLVMLRRRRRLAAEKAADMDAYNQDVKAPLQPPPAELEAPRQWAEADSNTAWELEGSTVPEKSVVSDRTTSDQS